MRVGVVILGLAACGGRAPAEIPDAPPADPPTLPAGVEVVLEARAPEDDTRKRDVTGLVLALLELGIGDIPGVVPRVAGSDPSPGLREAVVVVGERWNVTVDVEVGRPDVSIQLAICPPERPCFRETARAPADDPAPATYVLIEAVAEALSRTIPGSAKDDQVARGSPDPYALRLAGRAASAWYGWIPPSPYPGDPRRDPIARALLVDPSLPVAGWIAARDADRRQTWSSMHQILERPRLRRPSSAILAADEAAGWAAAGRWDAAAVAWSQLRQKSPDDPRWLPASAAVLLALGRRSEAEGLLDQLPPGAWSAPRVAAMRVESGLDYGFDETDDRLSSWAAADPEDPEPLRRRVRLRVDAGDFEAALALLPELEERGATLEARTLRPALLAAANRWEDAARFVDDPALASAIRQRASR